MKRTTCACGGEITAREGAEDIAVYAHNETNQHQAWRRSQERTEDRGDLAWGFQREQLRGHAA